MVGKKFVSALLIIGCATTVSSVWAGNLSAVINGKAIHIDPPAGSNYNESNWGIGVQYDFEPLKKHWIPFVTASEFRDSNKNLSYYAGGGFMRRYPLFDSDTLYAEVGAVAFVMKREQFNDDKPFLGVLPAFSVGTERIAVNMTFIPKIDPKMTALWFFQLKVSLSR